MSCKAKALKLSIRKEGNWQMDAEIKEFEKKSILGYDK